MPIFRKLYEFKRDGWKIYDFISNIFFEIKIIPFFLKKNNYQITIFFLRKNDIIEIYFFFLRRK